MENNLMERKPCHFMYKLAMEAKIYFEKEILTVKEMKKLTAILNCMIEEIVEAGHDNGCVNMKSMKPTQCYVIPGSDDAQFVANSGNNNACNNGN